MVLLCGTLDFLESLEPTKNDPFRLLPLEVVALDFTIIRLDSHLKTFGTRISNTSKFTMVAAEFSHQPICIKECTPKRQHFGACFNTNEDGQKVGTLYHN